MDWSIDSITSGSHALHAVDVEPGPEAVEAVDDVVDVVGQGLDVGEGHQHDAKVLL